MRDRAYRPPPKKQRQSAFLKKLNLLPANELLNLSRIVKSNDGNIYFIIYLYSIIYSILTYLLYIYR